MNISDLVVSYDEFSLNKEALIKRGVLVTDMPNDDYHSHDGISSTGIRLIKQSPAHYKYPEPFKQTRPMQVGSAIHAAILELEYFKEKYMLLDEVEDRKKPEYKKAKDALGEEFVFVKNEARQIRGMYQAVRKHKKAFPLLQEPGWSELSGFKRDENGVIRKVRFDRLTETGKIIDLKKTQDARIKKFSKSIGEYFYDMQATWYIDTFELITGEQADGFRFIAVEEKSPNGVNVFPIDQPSAMIGRDYNNKSYETYLECKSSGVWPCYDEDGDEIEVGLPSWRVYEWEDSFCENPEGEFDNE